MIRQIIIKSISLKNFKGLKLKELTINNNIRIYGSNGTGKTTIFDAFTWLLFGKDSIYNLNRFEKDYEKLITSTLINKCQVVFTLIPYQSNMKNKTLIDSMNTISSRLLNKYNIKYININPIISKDGFLLNEFTTDGVHFSNKANIVWGEELRGLIK